METTFIGIECRKASPTKKHRAVIWEAMLGTVYAMNKAGEIRYFDYRYDEAKEFAELGEDLRVDKLKYATRFGNGNNPSHHQPSRNQLVLYSR